MNRKLTAADVCRIRQHEADVKQEALAAKYHISQQAVSLILHGRRWCWCGGPVPQYAQVETKR